MNKLPDDVTQQIYFYKHNLESNNKDVLVFEEKDEEFSCILFVVIKF